MPFPELVEGPTNPFPEPAEGPIQPISSLPEPVEGPIQGAPLLLHFATCQTPVGEIGVIGGPAGIRSVGWRLRPGPASRESDSSVERAVDQLHEYFAGTRCEFDLPLDLPTLEPATRAVLMALRDVPYGRTLTYGELAERSGTGLPARAIGSVMGANPVPIVIPCHRVVAGDGLGGYSGGEPGRGRQTKLWLLEHEGALPPALI